MRFFTPLLALFATVVFAQNNAINVPGTGLQIYAGRPNTITWSNPSSGTVTIKLQQGSNITPDSGIVLSSTVNARDQTFTFTVNPGDVNTFQYTIEIIDNTNPNNYNFSPNFGIIGATGTSVSTASTASATVSGMTITMSNTMSVSTSSGSASVSSMSISSMSASASRSSSSSASSSRASATASSSNAPNSNSGVSLKVHGGLLAAVAGMMAIL